MITKDNNLKVMENFFRYPHKGFHIRELSRVTGLSSTGIIKIVKRLKKEKLLVSKKVANLEEIMPDFEGRFLLMKRLYNIYSLYESGLIDRLKSFYEMPQSIILFGSYSDGTDTEKSDIDLAIISKSHSEKMPELMKFESRLARKISLHIVNLTNTPKEFKNSIANGIVLEGFAELVK